MPGAGGGGNGKSGSVSGSGAAGQVIVSYSCPTYSLSSTSAVSPICSGTTSSITLTNSNPANLPAGNYIVTYNLSAPNAATGSTAAMTVVTAGTGSFNTPALLTGGVTTITITNIASGLCSSAVSLNNTTGITVNQAATAIAGAPQTICSNGTATLSGSIGGGATSSIWTAPSGSFSNPNSLTSSYTPAITGGTVTLTLTTNDPDGAGPCPAASSTMVITVSQAATANAGGSQTICAGGTITLAGTIGGSATSATWSAPSGTFSNPNSLTSTYTPVISNGTITLTLTTNDPDGAGPCSAAVSSVVLTVNPPATANAGPPRNICSGSTIALAGSIGGSATSSTWTASSGTFSDPNSPTANYTPGIPSGTVTLTLTTNDPDGAGPCSAAVSTVVMTVITSPSATASASSTLVCPGQPFDLFSSSDMGYIPPTILYEDFNGGSNNWTKADNSSGGTVANSRWTLRPDSYITDGTNFHSNDQTQFYLSDSRSQGGGTSRTETFLTSPVMNTVGYGTLQLDFFHYYRFGNASNESAKVEVSTNGTTWTSVVTYTNTQGTSNAFANPVINLTSYVGNPVFYVRFHYFSNARARYWAIDNVTVSGVPALVPVVSWTSIPAGFVSDVANPANITQTATTTYVVSYTNPITNCSGTASVTVTKLNDTEFPVFHNVPANVDISCQACIQAFVNADFENNSTIPCWAYIPNGGVPGWQSTTGTIEIQHSGCVDGVASYSGNYHAELNSDQVGDLYQSFCTVPTTTVQVSFAHHKRMKPTRSTDDIMGVWTGPNLSSLTQIGTFTATETSGWQVHTIALDIPVGQTITIFLFRAIQGAGPNPPLNTYGNLIDNIQAVTLFTPTQVPYATDNCPNVSVNLVEQKLTGVCAGNYQLIRTWTATDGSGNQSVATQTVTIGDFTPPVIVSGVPANATYDCTDVIPPAPPLSSIMATDNCAAPEDITISYTETTIPGPCASTYTLNRKWTATDQCANSSSSTQVITVHDITSPVITCPENYSTQADPGKTFATISLPAPTYSDNCTPVGNIIITWTMSAPTAGSGTGVIPGSFHFNVGTTTVTYTAADPCGNSASCSFTVEVTPNDPPVISCPANIFKNTDIGLCSVSTDPGFPTKVSGTEPITYSWAMTGATTGSGTGPIGIHLFNPGVTTITWIAENIAGSDTCSQLITVMDAEKPRFLSLPVSVRYFCVIAIFQANFYPDTVDISPVRPDYYILTPADKSSLDLNQSTFWDNCTPAASLILHWRIDFNGGAPSPVTGTGQISNYSGELRFPGIPRIDVTHKISYWLEDSSGNLSDEIMVSIIIKPRPDVVKLTH